MDMRNLLKIVEGNQQITEAKKYKSSEDLYFDVIEHFNGEGKDRRFAESLRTKAEAGVPISELVVLFNNFCLKKWGRKLNRTDAEGAVRNITEISESVELHDSFDIEIGEDLLIETGVVDFTEDGVVLEADEETLKLLSEHGVLLEEVDVVLESVRQKDPRIDFKSWEDPEKLKYYDEPTISRVGRGDTTIDTTPYDTPPSMRDPDRGKTPIEKRRASLIRQGIIKADEVKESEIIDEPLNSAGQAIARRIVTVNHELLIKYGLDKVLNAIRTVSEDLTDLEEIGTSDVSAWVHSVERMLSSENNSDMRVGPKNLEDKPLSEVDKISEMKSKGPSMREIIKHRDDANRARDMRLAGDMAHLYLRKGDRVTHAGDEHRVVKVEKNKSGPNTLHLSNGKKLLSNKVKPVDENYLPKKKG